MVGSSQCGRDVPELLQLYIGGGPASRPELRPVSAPYIQVAAHPQVGALHASAAAPTLCHASHNGQRCHLFLSSNTFYIHI